MHNTTHYRRLMLCVIMLMMMITTGCPGGNKQKKTSPKKKTEQEGTISTNEADTDNKNNGKTLDHYKKIVEDKFSDRSSLDAKDDSEKKQLILAYATILAVLDDNEEAVDEGIKLTEKATLFLILKYLCFFRDVCGHFLIKLGKVPAEAATTGTEIRKKTKEILDKLLDKNKDSRKGLREFCLEKMKEDEKKGEEELYMFRDADGMTHWYIEDGLDNEARKAFLESRGPKLMEEAIRWSDRGDIVDLLVKHGVPKNEGAK